MTARLTIVRTQPLEPIRIMDERMPPAPSLWLWLLLVIPFWWFVAWVVFWMGAL